jgi:hypothetical protein
MTARRRTRGANGRQGPARTIRVTGVLDISEALCLAEAVGTTADGAALSVDLRSARETHDAAVVALARALGERDVAIIGLSRHHERLLGYVGPFIGESAP